MVMMNVKHLIPCVLAILSVLLLSGCGEQENPTRTSLEADTSTLTLFVGESAFRAATTKAEHYRITYTSSNPAVATVDRMGKVTGVSEGDAVITIDMAESIEDWYAPKKLTYNVVVVKKPVSDETTAAVPAPVPAPTPCTGSPLNSATVGMIICSHGKVHAATTGALSCGGMKVAIVAYKGAAGSADTSAGSSGYCGLAIALNDANGGATCQWWDNTNANCVSNSSTTSTAFGFMAGIEDTQQMANATGVCSGHTHDAAKAVNNYQYDASVSAGAHPTGTSQWFLPTIGQWILIVKGMCGDLGSLTASIPSTYYYTAGNFNVKILAAGGTGVKNKSYWTSVELNKMNTWNMNFATSSLSNSSKTSTNCYVRAVLAF